MKSITRMLLALMMFSLFSISYFVTSVSADMDPLPDGSSREAESIMKSESVDLNKQTLQSHKRIEELENTLNEERGYSRSLSADLNKQTARSQKRIAELENQLKAETAKSDKFSADLNKQTARPPKRAPPSSKQRAEYRRKVISK